MVPASWILSLTLNQTTDCREKKNKLIYVQKSPAAFKAPKLRGRMKIMVARGEGELVDLPIPKSSRALVSDCTFLCLLLTYITCSIIS